MEEKLQKKKSWARGGFTTEVFLSFWNCGKVGNGQGGPGKFRKVEVQTKTDLTKWPTKPRRCGQNVLGGGTQGGLTIKKAPGFREGQRGNERGCQNVRRRNNELEFPKEKGGWKEQVSGFDK